MSALDRVTDALQAHGSANKGHDWVCPAHPDKDPSLSVNEGANGVVMRCHAGCDNQQILGAIGLKMSDLFDEPIKHEKRSIVATYPYENEQGELLFEVVRYEPKDFRQRVRDGVGGYRWSVAGTRRVIYRLPQVRRAINDGRRVYVVEGEKDADAFFARGEVATCNPGGAGKWRPEFSDMLAGATAIIVCDNDPAGAKHAREVHDAIAGVVNSVQLARPKVGKDAFDHFAAGYSVDELLPADVEDVGDEEDPKPTNSLRAHILTYSEIKKIPPPTYVIEDLVVADSLFVLYGLPGSTKSFIALDWALSMAHGRPEWMGKSVLAGPVLYIVAEGLSGIGIRVSAWEADREVSGEGTLQWVDRPVNLLDTRSVAELVEIADEFQPMLVVIDTLARSIPGADENAPGPMSAAIEAMDEIRRTTRAATGCVHHTPKDGSTPRGHSNLLGAVQSSIKVEKSEEGIKLASDKQKDGEDITMRMSLHKVGESAVLHHSSGPNVTSASIMSELELTKVFREMVGPEGASTNLLIELSGMSKATLYRAMTGLRNRGVIINIGTEKQTRWVLQNP